MMTKEEIWQRFLEETSTTSYTLGDRAAFVRALGTAIEQGRKEGRKALVEEAKQKAVRPEPGAVTQYAYIDIHVLEEMAEGEGDD
jgi:hypothetical protein